MDPLMPPPIRRIALDRDPHVAPPRTGANGERPMSAATAARALAARPASVNTRERMRIESVSLAYGERWVVRDVTLPVRQGEVLAGGGGQLGRDR